MLSGCQTVDIQAELGRSFKSLTRGLSPGPQESDGHQTERPRQGRLHLRQPELYLPQSRVAALSLQILKWNQQRHKSPSCLLADGNPT